MTVTETFFAVAVRDMTRATTFYERALGAKVMFPSPAWSSLRIAGVRVGLFLHSGHTPTRVGLHFVVTSLANVRAGIVTAGGEADAPETEVAPGVVVADVTDTEGNTFTLRQA